MIPGPWQIIIIVVLILLLFGAGRLPRVMNDIAQGIKSFKKGIKEDDGTDAEAETKQIENIQDVKADTVDEKSKTDNH